MPENEMPSQHGHSVEQDGIVFVKGTTSTKGLASCIFASATKEKRADITLRGIGAGANNQMTKATILAKGELSKKGIYFIIDMYFKDVDSKRDGEDGITAIEYKLTFS